MKHSRSIGLNYSTFSLCILQLSTESENTEEMLRMVQVSPLRRISLFCAISQMTSDGDGIELQQIKQLLSENSDMKMAMEEAYVVIESLETANETLKLQLLSTTEAHSKADVLSLHNDRMIVSLDALQVERDEALNLKQIAEARYDKVMNKLSLGESICHYSYGQVLSVLRAGA